MPCKGNCGDHSGHEKQLEAMTEQMDHLLEMPEKVAKLTGRMNLLLLIFSIVGVSVIGGVIYSFTAITFFKDEYVANRIVDKAELVELVSDIKEANTNFKFSMHTQIADLKESLDERLDDLEKANAVLNATHLNGN